MRRSKGANGKPRFSKFVRCEGRRVRILNCLVNLVNHLSASQPANQPTNQSINQSINPNTWWDLPYASLLWCPGYPEIARAVCRCTAAQVSQCHAALLPCAPASKLLLLVLALLTEQARRDECRFSDGGRCSTCDALCHLMVLGHVGQATCLCV